MTFRSIFPFIYDSIDSRRRSWSDFCNCVGGFGDDMIDTGDYQSTTEPNGPCALAYRSGRRDVADVGLAMFQTQDDAISVVFRPGATRRTESR